MTSFITDIHAHILPGIDDGPDTMEDAEELMASFSRLGTDRVFCTSHFCSPHFDVTRERLDEAYSLVASHGSLPIEIAPGAEVRLSSALKEVILADRIPTLGNTRYVLVEFRSDRISTKALDLMHELVIRELVPIVAHPERNIAVQKSPGLVDELIERGAIMQLTAHCFHGRGPSRMAEKMAWHILEKGQAAVIASDAHDCSLRPPGLLDAYGAIADKYGHQVVDQLIQNANAIWENQPVSEIAISQPKRTLFGNLFHRKR
jgi:protein-tyrosine phosphatase